MSGHKKQFITTSRVVDVKKQIIFAQKTLFQLSVGPSLLQVRTGFEILELFTWVQTRSNPQCQNSTLGELSPNRTRTSNQFQLFWVRRRGEGGGVGVIPVQLWYLMLTLINGVSHYQMI